MSNPLEPTPPALGGLRSPSPEVVYPTEWLEEAASLLAGAPSNNQLRWTITCAPLATPCAPHVPSPA